MVVRRVKHVRNPKDLCCLEVAIVQSPSAYEAYARERCVTGGTEYTEDDRLRLVVRCLQDEMDRRTIGPIRDSNSNRVRQAIAAASPYDRTTPQKKKQAPSTPDARFNALLFAVKIPDQEPNGFRTVTIQEKRSRRRSLMAREIVSAPEIEQRIVAFRDDPFYSQIFHDIKIHMDRMATFFADFAAPENWTSDRVYEYQAGLQGYGRKFHVLKEPWKFLVTTTGNIQSVVVARTLDTTGYDGYVVLQNSERVINGSPVGMSRVNVYLELNGEPATKPAFSENGNDFNDAMFAIAGETTRPNNPNRQDNTSSDEWKRFREMFYNNTRAGKVVFGA